MVRYLSTVGGCIITSFISRACPGSIFESTWAYFASSSVIPHRANCPSSCRNHNSGSSGQNGGTLMAIFETRAPSSSISIAPSRFGILIVRLSTMLQLYGPRRICLRCFYLRRDHHLWRYRMLALAVVGEEHLRVHRQ